MRRRDSSTSAQQWWPAATFLACACEGMFVKFTKTLNITKNWYYSNTKILLCSSPFIAQCSCLSSGHSQAHPYYPGHSRAESSRPDLVPFSLISDNYSFYFSFLSLNAMNPKSAPLSLCFLFTLITLPLSVASTTMRQLDSTQQICPSFPLLYNHIDRSFLYLWSVRLWDSWMRFNLSDQSSLLM